MNWRVLSTAAVCCVGAIGSLCFYMRPSGLSSENDASPAVLEVTPSSIDFGIVSPGRSLDATFRLCNCGTDELRIENLRTSCGCAPARVDKSKLLRGESTTLNVSFRVPPQPGEILHTVSFETSAAAARSMRLPIRAFAEWPIEANPANIGLSACRVSKPHFSELELHAPRGSLPRITTFKASAPWITCTEIATDLRRARFRVRVQPQVPGPFMESLEFETTARERPLIVVPIVGEAVGSITCRPAQFVIGNAAPGMERTLRAIVESDKELSLETVEISEADWTVVKSVDEQVQKFRLLIQATIRGPEEGGFHRAMLRIRFAREAVIAEIPVCVQVSAD